MFDTEMNISVMAMYYFRSSIIDKKLIKDMLTACLDVGIHFETIAEYIKENEIDNRDDIDMVEMKTRLADGIKQFETIIEYKT